MNIIKQLPKLVRLKVIGSINYLWIILIKLSALLTKQILN